MVLGLVGLKEGRGGGGEYAVCVHGWGAGLAGAEFALVDGGVGVVGCHWGVFFGSLFNCLFE